MKASPHKHVQPYLAPGMVIAMLSVSGREVFIFRLDGNGDVKYTPSENSHHDKMFCHDSGSCHNHWFGGTRAVDCKIATVESMHIGDVTRSQLKRWKKMAHKRLGIK